VGRSATFETPAKTPSRPLPIAVRRIVPAMSARGAANNAPASCFYPAKDAVTRRNVKSPCSTRLASQPLRKFGAEGIPGRGHPGD